ncbi:CGNR zinc finger domain-containing protein [Streptomyces sp. NPDC048518]|uniref:CGNR zinc finger domain-containing protein n=1 Tax=Streptomyces sp. NPDC048518 TaxID=3155029 RepID=UPI0033F74FBC
MTWSATERYRLESAPGGLALVQDLLNTVAAGGPAHRDLLADVADAQKWTDGAIAAWAAVTGRQAPRVTLDEAALRELRGFRDALREAAAVRAAESPAGDHPEIPELAEIPEHSGEAVLRLGVDGVVRLEVRGHGGHRLVALVLAEVYEGQRADTGRRLKACRNPECRVAFYDRSRNNSGVWHDVKTCGNAANLRAYRARQRER